LAFELLIVRWSHYACNTLLVLVIGYYSVNIVKYSIDLQVFWRLENGVISHERRCSNDTCTGEKRSEFCQEANGVKVTWTRGP